VPEHRVRYVPDQIYRPVTAGNVTANDLRPAAIRKLQMVAYRANQSTVLDQQVVLAPSLNPQPRREVNSAFLAGWAWFRRVKIGNRKIAQRVVVAEFQQWPVIFRSCSVGDVEPAPLQGGKGKTVGQLIAAADPVRVIQDEFLTGLELSAIQQLGKLSGDVLIRRPTKIRRVKYLDLRWGMGRFVSGRKVSHADRNYQDNGKKAKQEPFRFHDRIIHSSHLPMMIINAQRSDLRRDLGNTSLVLAICSMFSRGSIPRLWSRHRRVQVSSWAQEYTRTSTLTQTPDLYHLCRREIM